MNEFLNPKSMATPGAAGAMVMFVANSICFQFPEVEFRWAAIVLSFLSGAIVFSAKELHLSHRAAFWVLNSLIIFSVGVGTSNIAAKVQQPSPIAQATTENTMLDLILPAARAQERSDQPKAAPLPDTVESQLAAITKLLERQTQLMLDLQDENRKLRVKLAKLQAEAAPVQVEKPQSSNAARLLVEQRRLQQEVQRFEEQRKQVEEQQTQDEALRRELEAARAAIIHEQKASDAAARAKAATKSRDEFFKAW